MRSKITRPLLAVVLATSALTLGSASTVFADEPAAGTDDGAMALNGLRAVRDKNTGQLRAPNASELKEMEAAERAARKSAGEEAAATSETIVTQHANGMLGAKLGPEYLLTLRGTRRVDGSIEKSHDSDGHEHDVVRDDRPTE